MASLAGDWPPATIERLDLFAQQLMLASELVRAGGLARERMALVAVDNLAEIVLYRHVESTYAASEDWGGRLAVRRYDQVERNRLRRDFDRRVALAMTRQDGVGAFAYPKPVLNEYDATIFRVAHRHRNAVYHADSHNAALLAPLVRLYLTAVARAWSGAQPDVIVSSGDGPRITTPASGWSEPRSGIVTLRDTAADVALRLADVMVVDPVELATRLCDDLLKRASATDEARRDLARRGLPVEAHGDMLRAAELHYLHRADPELVRLQDEASAILERIPPKGGDDAAVNRLGEQFRQLEEAQRERVRALDASFRPQLNLRTARSIRRGAHRLAELRQLDRLLTRYESLDQRLQVLEDCLAWVDREWDRHTSLEEDIARGK
jgi:hypothetical protein